MYNAGNYIRDYHKDYHERLRKIRERESSYRDIKAHKMIKKLNNERIEKNCFSPRSPVLVSKEMQYLPRPGIY